MPFSNIWDAIVPYRRRLREITLQANVDRSEVALAIQDIRSAFKKYMEETDEKLRKHGEGIAEVDRKAAYTEGHLKAAGTQFVLQLDRIEKRLGLESIAPDPNLQLVKKGEQAPPRAPREVRKPEEP